MQIDYILVRCRHFITDTECKSVLCETIAPQYRSLIADLPLKPPHEVVISREKRRNDLTSRLIALNQAKSTIRKAPYTALSFTKPGERFTNRDTCLGMTMPK